MRHLERPFFGTHLATPLPGKLGAYADLYLQSLENAGRAVTTRYEYYRELRLLGDAYPDKDVAEIDTFDIELFLSRRCHQLSPNTKRKIHVCLSGFFCYLHERGKIERNPVKLIVRPAEPEPDPTWWEPDEVRRLIEAARGPRDHLLLETLARTGQRVGAVRTLTWDRVIFDPQEPVLRFPRAKGGKLHTVPMDRELIRDYTFVRKLTPPDAEWVFQSRSGGGPLSNLQINRIIADCCRRSGVRRAPAHEFRRSICTNLLRAGAEFSVVSKGVLNHSDPRTTMRHYAGVSKGEVARALRGLPY